MSISDLKVIIFEEKNLLKSLLELLDNQYEYLLDQDAMKVDKVARDLDDITKKVANSEIQRRKIMGNEANVGEVIYKTEDELLIKAYDEIQTILRDIQIQKDTNDKLLKNRIFFTKKMISMLNPNRPNQTYNAYGQMRK